MLIDAVVLAGGRASRLGGTSKPALRYGQSTLLQTAIDAVSSARQTVVVGDAGEIEAAAPGANVVVTREFPAFGGPAAAMAAGLDRLALVHSRAADFTMIVACDLPRCAEVVELLLAALPVDSDGVVAVSADGHVQYLAGVYSTARLRECVSQHRDAGDLDGLSVRSLLAGLKPHAVADGNGSTDDVDTWPDAERLGVVAAHPIAK